MSEQELLDSTAEIIKQFYVEHSAKHGLQAGWSFLYSPRKTFSLKTPLFLVGLNPGGTAAKNAGEITSERGNAYFVERWGLNCQPNKLQKQIGMMYDELVRIISPQIPRQDLIDNTLAANFAPFRSPKWDSLRDRSELIEFSRGMWKSVLSTLNPKVMICFSRIPYEEFTGLFIQNGYQKTKEEKEPINWGKVTVEISSLFRADKSVLLVRLPHLSRYQLFGREKSFKAAQFVCSRVANVLSDTFR